MHLTPREHFPKIVVRSAASEINFSDIARLLLKRGADATAVNKRGETPGDLAKRCSPPVYDVIKAYQRHDEDDGE